MLARRLHYRRISAAGVGDAGDAFSQKPRIIAFNTRRLVGQRREDVRREARYFRRWLFSFYWRSCRVGERRRACRA